MFDFLRHFCCCQTSSVRPRHAVAAPGFWWQATDARCPISARADVQMFWHPQGTYLAVQVDRFTKTKKSIYTSFELFSLKVNRLPSPKS